MIHILIFNNSLKKEPLSPFFPPDSFYIQEIHSPDQIDEKVLHSKIDVIIIKTTLQHSKMLRSALPASLPKIVCLELTDSLPEINHHEDLLDYIYLPIKHEYLHHKVQQILHLSSLKKDILFKSSEIEELHNRIDTLNKSVEGHNSFLELISQRDGLTGLFNRRHFNTVIKKAFSRSITTDNELCLLIANIDYFNEINKSCGQQFGDFVLNEFSARLTKATQTTGLCFRLSGEEFAILLPDTTIKTGLGKGEEIRRSCITKEFENESFSRPVTVSIGIAGTHTHSPETSEELINMADQALFLAKSEGRNRCLQHQPVLAETFGSSEKNYQKLKDTFAKILDKTKISTMRSLELLAQGAMSSNNSKHLEQAHLISQMLSQQLQFPPPLIETFKNSITLLSTIRCLMHNEMLSKEGVLSETEWQTIHDFPYKIVQLTELFDYFSSERTILLHHGENFDGSGYPEGKKGEEIPIGARIFKLVSAVAAMNSDRPYRKKLTPKQILRELQENSGKQFDPELVAKLIDILEEKNILELPGKDFKDT